MREEKLKSINLIYINEKAKELAEIFRNPERAELYKAVVNTEHFVLSVINDVRRERLNIDPEEIIQAVLDHIDCHHALDHDEDGLRSVAEYDVDDKCHEAVRKVLGVEK